MAKRKKPDSKALIKAIEDGMIQTEIMEKHGFKNSTQLKVAYANALIDAGRAAAIKSGRKAKAVGNLSREVSVGKRGSLIVPRALVEEMGFQVGDTFGVSKTKSGLSLSRAEAK